MGRKSRYPAGRRAGRAGRGLKSDPPPNLFPVEPDWPDELAIDEEAELLEVVARTTAALERQVARLAVKANSRLTASSMASTGPALGGVMPKSVMLTPVVALPLTAVSVNRAVTCQVTGLVTPW